MCIWYSVFFLVECFALQTYIHYTTFVVPMILLYLVLSCALYGTYFAYVQYVHLVTFSRSINHNESQCSSSRCISRFNSKYTVRDVRWDDQFGVRLSEKPGFQALTENRQWLCWCHLFQQGVRDTGTNNCKGPDVEWYQQATRASIWQCSSTGLIRHPSERPQVLRHRPM